MRADSRNLTDMQVSALDAARVEGSLARHGGFPMKTLRSLERRGLLVADNPISDSPTFTITTAGREALTYHQGATP